MNSPLKVFILEDQKTDQELVKRQVLKFDSNATFTISHNQASFLEKIEWLKPDLILADYNLPDMSGLDALFYAKEKLPNTPFIFVTASLGSQEYVAETILKGADGYCSKNNLSALPQAIKEALEKGNKKRALQLEITKRQNKKQLLIQKLASKIVQISDKDLKVELHNILEEIQNL